jgi:TorA maturation chaperone TorD
MNAMADEARIEAVVAAALARAAVYRILGSAFAYPTGPRLEELAGLAALAAGRAEHPPAVQEALRDLSIAARAADPDSVATEYVFLFDRQVRCPPYEGAWGETLQLAGKGASLADIAGFYRAFGLDAGAAQPDTEDHVVAELEFLSALALKEAWALAEDHAEQVEVTHDAARAFLTDHLGRWGETFAAAVAGATPLPYYAAAAALLGTWIRAEIERLGVAPARVGNRIGDDVMQADALTCPMADEPPSDAAAPG